MKKNKLTTELFHHGIKGQKWGVRRFQNPNGTLTTEGKKRKALIRKTGNAMKTTKDANEIVETLTKREKKLLGASQHEKWIEPEFDAQTSSNIAKRFVQYEMKENMKIPVGFLEVWDNGGNVGQIAIATKSGDQYRGKGHASKSVKQGLDWYNKYGYKKLERLEWIAEKSNAASNALAKKSGFKEANWEDYDWDPQKDYNLYVYEKKPKSAHDSKTIKALASSIHDKASKKVDRIEGDVLSSIKSTNAKIYGLDHKQKTLDSIIRKIETDSSEKRISFKEAADNIKDAVRFSTVSSDNNFVNDYNRFKSEMSKKGYDELQCKNYWQLYAEGKAKHKQVTSVFGDDTGYRFEVQFQTPSSINAKEKKTKLYEEVRKEGVPEHRRTEISNKMEEIAQTVTDPKGIDKIKSHSSIYGGSLQHHGVQGQHWGERNGPPYPLNAKGQLKKVHQLINELNTKWDYGVLVDGKRITDTSQMDWSKYRTLPIEKLAKEKIGVCWDFVNYQHAVCKKNGYPDKNYMIVCRRSNKPDDILTHTFTIVEIGGKKYWIESARWKDRGVHEVNSYKDVVQKLQKDDFGNKPYDLYDFNPDGMDKGLTDKQYFDKATQNLVETSQNKRNYKKII